MRQFLKERTGMTQHTEVPTDQDIRRLLRTSREQADPRIAAALTFTLFLGFSLKKIISLNSSQIDFRLGLLRAPGAAPAIFVLPELLLHQLLAIPSSRRNGRIFRSSEEFPGTLTEIFTRFVVAAGFQPSDLVSWSQAQTPDVRKAVASL